MPHIKKRGNIYHVFWYEKRKDIAGSNSKKKGKKKKGKKKKGIHRSRAISPLYQVAKEWAANKAAQLYAKKNDMLVQNYSFLDFCDEYIKNYSKEFKRERSVLRDLLTIKIFKRVCPEVEYVHDFTDRPLALYKVRREKEGVSESSINREVGTLKNMQLYAFNEHLHDKNYSPLTSKLDTPELNEYIPDNKTLQLFFSDLQEPYKTACVLSLYLGFRRGEATHSELIDYNFDENYINITDKPHLNWSPKTKTSKRRVPLHPEIKEYLFLRYEKAKKVGSQFICFFDDDGRALDEDVLSSMITKIRKKKKLPKVFNFRCLRRKFVTQSTLSSGDLTNISLIVGHSTIKTTQKSYFKPTMDDKLKSISTLHYPGVSIFESKKKKK
ncbi:MAG: site-specific integrase [Elusimicrobiota bacterium]|jgi:integrase|nr:site-specific integrase [Elusimicrobiota bacterium]